MATTKKTNAALETIARRRLAKTPAERADQYKADIKLLLGMLEDEMDFYTTSVPRKRQGYEYVKRLRDFRETLTGSVTSLLILRYEWSGDEAEDFVNDFLEDSRSYDAAKAQA
jgi:hypothetical protein